MDIAISAYSSLNFDHAWRRHFQQPLCYRQPFLPDDIVRVQYTLLRPVTILVRLYDLQAGTYEVLTPVLVSTASNIYEVSFIAREGSYRFSIFRDEGGVLSEQGTSDFCVVADGTDTVRFQYTNRRSDFDTVFQYPFLFRAEGSFLPQEAQFLVDAEDFRDQRYTFHQLSAIPYRKDVLTVGGQFGVPNWVAEKINRILALSDVWIDGRKVARSEGSTPEITIIHPSYPLYYYKIELEFDRYSDLLGAGDFGHDFNNDFSK